MRQRAGLTLIEALLAATLLAAVIGAVLCPFAAAASNQKFAERQTLASFLAQEMMEEVLSMPYADPDGDSEPGPEFDESSRSAYDNIDDYDGLDEPPGAITSFDGTVFTGDAADGLSRHTAVKYVFVSGQDTSADATFAEVTVTVKHEGREIVRLRRLVYEVDS